MKMFVVFQTGMYLRPEDVHWNLSDLGWAKAAWSSFYGPWQMGACVFALDVPGKFDPVLALKTLAAFPITTWCAPPTALRLIVRQGAWQLLAGMILGLGLAAGVAQLTRVILFEVQPRDPQIFGGVVGVLAVSGLLACLIPALRTTRVDPLVALRSE
jgi:hypothetical protein